MNPAESTQFFLTILKPLLWPAGYDEIRDIVPGLYLSKVYFAGMRMPDLFSSVRCGLHHVDERLKAELLEAIAKRIRCSGRD
jgi:hypothetical protein